MHRFASIVDLSSALARRHVSAVELAREVIATVARIAPRYNALAAIPEDRALREAANADRQRARRAASRLRGVPYGAKDIFDATGAPTTWGAPAFRDRVAARDATVIGRLARRGGVLAAKLATVELAGGGSPRRPGASIFGPPRNPWDPARYAGGSSSGPAIAVALGLLPYALASETGGSILTPSAFSGVTGLRPTYGLVPRTGVMALSWTLDKAGIIARTAEDIAIVLAAIAGPDRHDASTARRRFHPLARPRPRSVRIAYAGTDVEESAPHTRRALGDGIADMLRVAPTVVHAALDDDLPYVAAIDTVMQAEAATIFAEYLEDPSFTLVDDRQLAVLRASLEIRARDYLQAMRIRSLVAERFRSIFERADVILSVGRTITAPALDGPAPVRVSHTVSDRLRTAANLAGLPGVFFPCGLADDGLPVGLQLVGPPFSEPLLLALVQAYQRETGHHLRRPPDPA